MFDGCFGCGVEEYACPRVLVGLLDRMSCRYPRALVLTVQDGQMFSVDDIA